MKPKMNDVFVAVGQVVCTAQLFEFVFVLAVRLALKQPDVSTLEDVAPVQIIKALRQPVKAVLNEIAGENRFDAALTERIVIWLETRHHIIHRQVSAGGWPDESSPPRMQAFIDKCVWTSDEGLKLVNLLFPMLADWLARFPELKEELAVINKINKGQVTVVGERPNYSHQK